MEYFIYITSWCLFSRSVSSEYMYSLCVRSSISLHRHDRSLSWPWSIRYTDRDPLNRDSQIIYPVLEKVFSIDDSSCNFGYSSNIRIFLTIIHMFLSTVCFHQSMESPSCLLFHSLFLQQRNYQCIIKLWEHNTIRLIDRVTNFASCHWRANY